MFADIFFALVAAILFSVLLVSIFGWRHPHRNDAWFSTLFAFILLFLVIYGIGVWITPYGPQIWGTYFIGFFWIGFLLMIFLIALGAITKDSSQTNGKNNKIALFSIFFWLLLLAVLIMISFRYFIMV